MKPETIVYEAWADSSVLVGLLPIAKLTFGTNEDENAELPNANLTVQSDQLTTRTSSGGVKTGDLRIQVWSELFEEGRDIAKAAEDELDDSERARVGNPPLGVRVTNTFALQEDDGIWQHVIDLSVMYSNT
jgi:hypothetical protein